MKEASYYEKLEERRVLCHLCPKECVIAEGRRGFCGVRSNEKGALFSDVYNRMLACHLDPIEKKPLYHFHPGKSILSIGTKGCNLRCEFCQNWEMLESDSPGTYITSDEVAAMSDRGDSIGVAYTYNEPTIWYEFVQECARKVRLRGLKNVLVTNGYINMDPLEDLLPYIDAMNIDVKSMDPGFYKDVCRATLEPVLDTCRRARRDCHIEITNLLIPGYNDSDELISELVDFVAELGRDTPLHFSAYYPCYKMTAPPTPVETLRRAYEIAGERLDFVYLGNIRAEDSGRSCCPSCGGVVVERDGYITRITGLEEGRCSFCGKEIPFIV